MRTVVLLVCAAVVLLAVGAGIEAWRAQRALTAAQTAARQVLDSGRAGDLQAAVGHVDDLADAAAQAHAATSGPLWWLTAHLPWVGDDAAAVSLVSRALDGTAAPARQLVHDAATATGRRSGSVGIDLAAVARMAGPARQLAAASESGAQALTRLPTAGLLPPVAEGVRAGAANLRQVADVAAPLAPLVSIAPRMLGGDGPRHYLLAVQNPAEPRPTGGIVGAVAALTVDRGTVRLVRRDINDRLVDPDRPLVDFGPDYRRLYGEDVALVANVNLSPHFPYAAQQLAAIAGANRLGRFDGVVAVDPAVLSSLLSVVGPVTVSDGTVVSASNAQDLLLRQVYDRFAGADRAREQFILSVFDAAFTRLNTTDAGPAALLGALAGEASRGHLLVWSATPREQATLARTPLAGTLPDAREDALGVYVTDAAGSKLGYYLHVTADLQLRCDASQRAGRLRVQLRNAAPDQVPPYVGNQRREPGGRATAVDIVTVVLPAGAGARDLVVDGHPQGFAVGRELGHPVLRTTVRIPPGGAATVELTVAVGSAGTPTLYAQPFVQPSSLSVRGCAR